VSEMKDSHRRLVRTDADPGCPPQDLLSLYGHGALSEDETNSVKSHLETCSSCGEYVRQIEIVLSMTSAPESDDPGELFNESMWRRIKAERTKRRAKLALYPALAAAAIALVFILPLSRKGVGVADQELVEQLDLFQHIELMENLDLVESIDFIMSDEGMEEES
jgi:anti-sigma factor RsiW